MSIDADLTFGTRPSAIGQLRSTGDASRQKSAVEAYAFSVLTTRDEILAIQPDWQALEGVSQGTAVFQSFDICLPWLEAYVFGADPTHRAHVLAVRDGSGRLAALAPLAQKLSRLTVMAEWIGEPLVQYGDILMDPDCDREAIGAALAQAFANCSVDGLVLRNVRADARIAAVLDLQEAQLGSGREAALADLTTFEKAEDYFATFSKRSRQNRRKINRDLPKQIQGHRANVL